MGSLGTCLPDANLCHFALGDVVTSYLVQMPDPIRGGTSTVFTRPWVVAESH